MKRIAAVFMSAVIVLSMLSFAAFGADVADNAQQILSEGGSKSTATKDITVSKVISPTEDENYFDITLKVEKKLPTTDVVMVLDISNTMNTNDRIGKAINSAKAFLKQYSESVGINDDSRIGLVQFNSNASVVFDLGNADENIDSYNAKIDDLIAPKDDNIKFTNIEGGLQLAQNLLKDSDAKQKYIILITDGFPTTYIESGRDSTTYIKGYDVYRTYKNPPSKTPTEAADGLFWDFVRNLACNGTSYSDTAAIKARTLATKIKNSGIDIYSIGIDISENQTVQKYVDIATPIVERTSESYEVGSATNPSAYVNWLGTSIGGGPDLTEAGVTNAFSRGDTDAQLETAFTDVLSLIATAEPMDVTDPMGDNVDFLGFYDKNGNLTDKALSGSYDLNAENTVSYGSAINWDIDVSGYTEKDVDNVTYRTFTLKYKVRLENEASGFVAEKKYDTNGKTFLEYKTIDMDSNDPAKVLDFSIPAVEGYFGSFEFTKVNNGGDKLSGAQFKLSHSASCSVCGGKVPIADKTDASDSNGKVSFASIPSGHEYVLTETVTPSGHVKNEKTYAVEVAYGKTYIDGKEAADFEVENELFASTASDSVSGTVSLKEGETDKPIKDGQFSVTVKPDESNNTTGYKFPADNTADVKADGTFDFGKIEFIKPGTYSFDITENNGGAAGYTYDGAKYTLVYTVEPDDSTNQFKVTKTLLTKDGEPAEKLAFVNSYATPAPVEIDVPGAITLTGGGKTDADIKDGFFTYTVSGGDADGVSGVPATEETAANGVLDFGTWSFSKVGEYEFVISENTPPAGYTDLTGDVTVKVVVTLNEETNTLEADVTYSSGEKVKIDNLYTVPDPVKVKLDVTADLVGDKSNDDINEGDFVFYIKADKNNDITAYTGFPEEVINVKTGGGALDFGSVEFTMEGEYKFIITQEQFSDDGYTYDNSEYVVTYIVTIDEATNEFVVETVIEKDGVRVDSIEYVNEYKEPEAEEEAPSSPASPAPAPGENGGSDGNGESDNSQNSQPSEGDSGSGGGLNISFDGIADFFSGLFDFGSDDSDEPADDEATADSSDETAPDEEKEDKKDEADDDFDLPFTGSEGAASLMVIFAMSAVAVAVLRKKKD